MLRPGVALLVLSAPLFAWAQSSAETFPDLARAMKDAGVGETRTCKSDEPEAVMVCGRRSERFRIDRHVLESSRAASAQPARRSLMDDVLIAQRYGDHPEHGRVIPNKLIGVPFGKGSTGAPELAIKGKTLPEAVRQGENAYAAYRATAERGLNALRPE